MDNVESGDEDVRKNLGAIPSAKAVNPHHQQQQQQQQQSSFLVFVQGLLFGKKTLIVHSEKCKLSTLVFL